MAFRGLFNFVYYKKDLEELADAAKRLNLLTKMQNLRKDYFQMFVYRDGQRYISIPRKTSIELDEDIQRKTKQTLKNIIKANPILQDDSLQELVHRELVALDDFIEKLSEKRARKSQEMSSQSESIRSFVDDVIEEAERISTEQSLVESRHILENIAEAGEEDEAAEEEEDECPSYCLCDDDDDQSDEDVEEADNMIVQLKIKPPENDSLTDGFWLAMDGVTVELSDCCFDTEPNQLDEEETEPKKIILQVSLDEPNTQRAEKGLNEGEEAIYEQSLLTEDESDDKLATQPYGKTESIKNIPPSSAPRHLQSFLGLNEKTCPWCFNSPGDRLTAGSKTKCQYPDEMTVEEALSTIKQDIPARDIFLLIGPVLSKSQHDSPYTKITALQKSKLRILGSFQIPTNRLESILDEEIFSLYSIVLLTTPIDDAKNVDIIVQHIARMSTDQLNYKEISRLFQLADHNHYRIFARPDVNSLQAIYICDFYTTSMIYIGTIKLYAAEVLRQLERHPRVLQNFEVFADSVDKANLAEKVKEIRNLLLDRFGFNYLYERFGSFFTNTLAKPKSIPLKEFD